MSTLKLSNSSVNKWLTCGKMYKLHYVDKIRPTTISSALVFGTAFDAAIEAEMRDGNAREVFLSEWERVAKHNNSISFFKSDLDLGLLESQVIPELAESMPDQVTSLAETVSLVNQAAFKKVSAKVFEYVNLMNYYSLQTKGLLMVDAFHRDIKPRIKEVISTQKEISLDHPDGDSAIGFVDLIVRLHDDTIAVLDIKTASRPYEEDSPKTSGQLSLYSYAVSDEIPHDYVGYVVILKKPKKNTLKVCMVCGTENTSSHKTCPETNGGKRCGGDFKYDVDYYCETQFLIDKPTTALADKVIDTFNEVSRAIKAEIYPHNLSVCADHFGSKCVYYDLCHSDSMENLINKSVDSQDQQ